MQAADGDYKRDQHVDPIHDSPTMVGTMDAHRLVLALSLCIVRSTAVDPALFYLTESTPTLEPDQTNSVAGGYSFSFAVRDDPTSKEHSHQETSDGRVVWGSYRVALPDGRVQVVKYRADHNGYVADVTYEGDIVYHVAYPPESTTSTQPPTTPKPDPEGWQPLKFREGLRGGAQNKVIDEVATPLEPVSPPEPDDDTPGPVTTVIPLFLPDEVQGNPSEAGGPESKLENPPAEPDGEPEKVASVPLSTESSEPTTTLKPEEVKPTDAPQAKPVETSSTKPDLKFRAVAGLVRPNLKLKSLIVGSTKATLEPKSVETKTESSSKPTSKLNKLAALYPKVAAAKVENPTKPVYPKPLFPKRLFPKPQAGSLYPKPSVSKPLYPKVTTEASAVTSNPIRTFSKPTATAHRNRPSKIAFPAYPKPSWYAAGKSSTSTTTTTTTTTTPIPVTEPEEVNTEPALESRADLQPVADPIADEETVAPTTESLLQSTDVQTEVAATEAVDVTDAVPTDSPFFI